MKTIKIKRADENIFYRGFGVIRFRPVLLLSLGFGLGIFLSYLCGLTALLLLVVAAFVIAIIFFIFLRRKKAVAGILCFALLVGALYSLGVLSFGIRAGEFENSRELSGLCDFAGEVDEIGESGYYTVLTIKNLQAITEEAEVILTNGKMHLYVRGTFDAYIGMRLMFAAEAETYDLYSYGKIDANAVLENIRYRAVVGANEIYSAGEAKTDLFAAARRKLRSALFENMDAENAALAYAMLTGDSAYIDRDTLQNFRYGGVAHIFAVSGLHIGVIYSFLSFLGRRLRLKSAVKVPIIFIILFLYVGICGFSPSSVRALVMCTVLMIAEALGRQYDRLNSVSLAALIVLAIDPMYLFSVGFQLSVAAAAGIIVLGGHLTRLLGRIRFLPYKVCSALGVAVSAQVSTFPIILDCFGYVSGIGLFLNLIFIPVIGFVYIFLFIGALFAALFPFAAHIILFLPECMLRFSVMPIIQAEMKLLLISGISFGALALLWYFAGFLVSDKVNLKPLPKGIAVCILCVVLTVAMVFRNGTFFIENMLTVHSYYGSNFIILREEEKRYLIALGKPEQDHLEKIFLKENITVLDGIIVLAAADEINSAVPVILNNAEAQTLYVSEESHFIDSFHTVGVEEKSGFFYLGDCAVNFLLEEVLYMNISGADVLVCSDDSGEIALPVCDLLIAADFDARRNAVCKPKKEVYFEKTEGKMSVYSSGDLQILWKNDIITIQDLE